MRQLCESEYRGVDNSYTPSSLGHNALWVGTNQRVVAPYRLTMTTYLYDTRRIRTTNYC